MLPTQDVRSLIEIQREAEAEQQRMDQAQARLTSLQHDYSKAVVAQTSTSTRLEQLQTQLTNASDKLTRAQHSWVEKKDRFRSSIARLREEYALVLKERDEDEQALREREKEIGRIQAEVRLLPFFPLPLSLSLSLAVDRLYSGGS
jgi:chromosome segregation ATPase